MWGTLSYRRRRKILSLWKTCFRNLSKISIDSLQNICDKPNENHKMSPDHFHYFATSPAQNQNCNTLLCQEISKCPVYTCPQISKSANLPMPSKFLPASNISMASKNIFLALNFFSSSVKKECGMKWKTNLISIICL